MPYHRLVRWAASHWWGLLAGGIFLGLLPLLLLCRYNQPFLCDFSVSTDVVNHGFWGAQPYLFRTWSGRYFTNFLLYVANPLSYGWLEGVQLTAALSQLLRLAVLYAAVRSLTGTQLRRRDAGLLAAGLTLFYIGLAPYKFSALYYFTEIVVYHVAAWLLLLVPVAIDRVQRAPSPPARRWWGVAAGVGTVAAAGSNELILVLLGVVMGLGAAVSAYRRQWHSFRVWAGFGALLLVFGTLSVLAPGNASRQQLDGTLAPAATLWEAAARLVVLLRYLFVEPAFLVIPFLTLLLAPLAARVLPARPPGLRLPLLLSVAVLVAGVVLGTAPYAMVWARVPLIPRATNIMVWWWLLGWILATWAHLAPHPTPVPATSPTVRVLLGAVVVVTMFIPSFRASLDLRYEAPEFARQWQHRFAAMQHASHTPHAKVQLPPLPPLTNRLLIFPPDELSRTYDFGVNTRLATWFGIDSVRVAPLP